MFLIGRSRFDDSGKEFWKWWPSARDRIATKIDGGSDVHWSFLRELGVR